MKNKLATNDATMITKKKIANPFWTFGFINSPHDYIIIYFFIFWNIYY